MYSIAQLKSGVKINFRGEPNEVIFAKHKKLARSQGQAQVKLKNLISGNIITHTFTGSSPVEPAEILYQPFQFLYEEKNGLVFMNPYSFIQIIVPPQKEKKWLVAGQQVEVIFWQDKAISFKLPATITLEVKQADPGIRGGRESAGLKKITLETGAIIDAPLFIKPKNRIIINTQTEKYVKRV